MHDVHLPADKTIVEGQDSLVNLCGRKRVVAVQLGSVSFLGQEGGHVESAKSQIIAKAGYELGKQNPRKSFHCLHIYLFRTKLQCKLVL